MTMISGRIFWTSVVAAVAALLFWNARRGGGADGPSAVAAKPEAPRVRSVVAEGRVTAYPGAEVVVCSEVGGLVVELAVQEKSVVHRGDLIARIRDDERKAQLDEARARIAEAEALLRYFDHQLDRDGRLLARKAGSIDEVEATRRDFALAQARRAAASAEADRYLAQIAKTRITAPIDGVVTARRVQPGETVEPSAPIVVVADLARVRVEAEVDEYDTGRIALGMPVVIRAEGYGDRFWRGTVEEIPDVVVGRRLRPEDPGRPVDTRVLLVKVALIEPTPLKLGQRVEVEIAVGPDTPSPGA